MRIGIICYPTVGGSGVVATELARGLSARGHEIHIFSYAAPARVAAFDENIRVHRVDVSSYPLFRYPPYELALATRLSHTVEEAELDVVHAHYAIPHTLAAILVKDLLRPRRLPVVTTLHGTDITVVGQDPSYARVTRYAIRRSDAVTSVSEYLREETDRIFDPQCRIDVIPNFVDPQRFNPTARPGLRERFACADEKIVVHLSNFRPVKRSVLAVDAFARVSAQMPARLLMVGEGPDQKACEARVRELGLRPRVVFLGIQTDVENLLPVADVLLLPSEYESFGLAALEAMACGTVPIVTGSGGLPEVVRDGVDGLLVPPDDIGSMGDRAVALLSDSERLAAMKTEARRAAVERFARDTLVPRYEEVYERVVTR